MIKYGAILDIECESVPSIVHGKESKGTPYLRDGDVIIADTAEDETVGKCCEIINVNGTKIESGLHTIPCRPMRSFSPMFLGYYMNSHYYHKQLFPLMQGVKVLSISRSNIGTTMISAPCSRSEQTRIVNLLHLIDNRIRKQQQVIDTLKKYKRGLLKQTFSDISESYRSSKLRDLVYVSGGKTPSMNNSLYWNGDIVWISSKDMKSNRIYDSELKITTLALNEMTLFPPGTLLLVVRSGILKHTLPLSVLEVEATINQDIKALQVHGCNSLYLYYAILAREDNIIRTHVKTGTTVQSLMMDSFMDIEIPIVDIEQQQIIASKLSKIERYVERHKKVLLELMHMRVGLLQQLFI